MGQFRLQKDMMSFACKICGASDCAEILHPRERMLGLGNEFLYSCCASCGCLQITNPPKDLGRFYNNEYYAFSGTASYSQDRFPLRRKFLYFPITAARLGWPSLIGRFLHKFGSGPFIPSSLGMLFHPLKKNAKILDVGCGNGRELFLLRNCGFRNLIGTDPSLPCAGYSFPDITISKTGLDGVSGKFDLIMFHHVLEHLPDQLETLLCAKKLLSSQGQILIRIPLSDSQAAKTYGQDWVQLDAPRHFFLHTRKSLGILSAKAGLRVAKTVYDSEKFQFIGSELYRRTSMSLNEFYSDFEKNCPKVFAPGELDLFEEQSKELNATCKGDQAGFCLLAGGEVLPL